VKSIVPISFIGLRLRFANYLDKKQGECQGVLERKEGNNIYALSV
jgi:hypothetical protein